MKREPRGESFIIKRFGFVFRIIIYKERTRASIIKTQDGEKLSVGTFEGYAIVHLPDIYDRVLGVKIAMRSALDKYGSFEMGYMKQKVISHKKRLRSFTGCIGYEIEEIRAINEAADVK